jgi:hypothetical protein
MYAFSHEAIIRPTSHSGRADAELRRITGQARRETPAVS